MSRLRRVFVFLVIGPAITFAVGGTCVAYRSRAALGPELDRRAAELASEYVRYERLRLREQLESSAGRLADRARDLAIERLTVYDDLGLVGTFPVDSPAVPLEIATASGDAMLRAARRGGTVVDLARVEGRVLWLAYVASRGRLTVALLTPDSSLAQRFQVHTGYRLALYFEDGLVPPALDDWPWEIDPSLRDSLASYDRPIRARLAGATAAAAPVKDFDDWDVVGAVLVRRTAEAPPIPAEPLLPILALFLAAGITAFTIGTLIDPFRLPPGQLRRRFALALVPPALASAWLAAADARISAKATEAFLELGGDVATAVEGATSLTGNQLAALTGAEAAVWRGDSLLTAGVERAVESSGALEARTGRLRTDGRRVAYRIADLGDGTRLTLFKPPLEDARKTTLFWLAGLYGLLVVGVLIYASLAFAASSAMEFREASVAWKFLSPSLLLLLLFSAGPLLFAFYLSFHEWNLLDPAKPFVGLRHYVGLARDGLFWNAAKNTVVYSLYVPATMVCALAVAMLLNRRMRGVALLRAVFFLPYVTSFVAISIVWQWMYDPDFGVFNWMLGLIGLGPYPWLNSPSTALLALIIMAVWIHIGLQMIIFLAGLQAIPSEYYEAAMIDGAGPWRRFWRITLPLLKPTTFFVLVTSIIGSFQVFTFVYVMTEGGPLHATDVIVYHIYQNAWQFLRMGYASAMSWVLFAVIFLVTLLQFRLLGRRMEPR